MQFSMLNLLAGITHPMKEEKIGLLRGTVARARMYSEVLGGCVAPTIESTRADFTRFLKELRNTE